MSRAAGWRVAVLMIGTMACTSDDAVGDAEIVALADRVIAELELNDPALEIIEGEIKGYDFDTPSTPVTPLPPPGLDPQIAEPANTVELYLQFSVAAYFNRNGDAALWGALKAVREAPSDAELLSHAATLAIDRDRCEEALTLLERAIALQDEVGIYHLNRSVAEACLGGNPIPGASRALELERDNRVVRQGYRNAVRFARPELHAIASDFETTCRQLMLDAVVVNSTADVSMFSSRVSNRTSELSGTLSGALTDMPSDLPLELLTDLLGAIDTHQVAHMERATAPLDAALASIDTDADAAYAVADDGLNACGSACNCAQNYCDDTGAVSATIIDPRTFRALQAFASPAADVLFTSEVELVGRIINEPNLSPATEDWALDYAYAVLELNCATVALQLVNTVQRTIVGRERTDTFCDAARMCSAPAELAALNRRRMDDEMARQAAATVARGFMEDAFDEVEPSVQFEFCLDSIFCGGLNGRELSVRIGTGGFAFAQLAVDVADPQLTIRAGANLTDITGNLGSADISFGGSVGPDGTSFNVTGSASALGGTVGPDRVILYEKFYDF